MKRCSWPCSAITVSNSVGLTWPPGNAFGRIEPYFPSAGTLDLDAADADESRVYLPAEGKLFARDLTSGRAAWTADLNAAAEAPPGTGWRVIAGRRAVIALPRIPIAADPPWTVAARIARRFTATCRLPAGLASVYDAWVARTLPVLLLDPETGDVRGRIDLPAGPVAVVRSRPDGLTIATTGRAYQLK